MEYVTKARALQSVIDKWVLGDHPFALVVEDRGAACVYDPSHPSGGCAIGQFLDAEHYDKQMETRPAHEVLQAGTNRSMFEDYDNQFWDELQRVHDSLALLDYHHKHPRSEEAFRSQQGESFESWKSNCLHKLEEGLKLCLLWVDKTMDEVYK